MCGRPEFVLHFPRLLFDREGRDVAGSTRTPTPQREGPHHTIVMKSSENISLPTLVPNSDFLFLVLFTPTLNTFTKSLVGTHEIRRVQDNLRLMGHLREAKSY